MFKEYSLYNNNIEKNNSNYNSSNYHNTNYNNTNNNSNNNSTSSKSIKDEVPLANNFMVNLSPYPEHTKMTRCNNNLRGDNNRIDFLRPIISNPSIPIISNHEHYLYDSNINDCNNNYNNNYNNNNNNYNNNYNNNNYNNNFDIERSSVCTRNNNSNSRKPVQNDIQNNYYSTNFESLNNIDNETNKYLTRNPVNTRRDNLEKERNNDKNDFLKIQGGMLNGNYADFKYETTRKGKNDINSSSYVPMPRTLAIPKEHI
jgi:hypothetical protein